MATLFDIRQSLVRAAQGEAVGDTRYALLYLDLAEFEARETSDHHVLGDRIRSCAFAVMGGDVLSAQLYLQMALNMCFVPPNVRHESGCGEYSHRAAEDHADRLLEAMS